MDNNIFDALNFIFKKTKISVYNLKNINVYLLNRWISMSDKNLCCVLNSTTNRWFKIKLEFNALKFYNCILPKNNKHITYIKKKNFNKATEDSYINTSIRMELSTREIEQYEEMIDFLNKNYN